MRELAAIAIAFVVGFCAPLALLVGLLALTIRVSPSLIQTMNPILFLVVSILISSIVMDTSGSLAKNLTARLNLQ